MTRLRKEGIRFEPFKWSTKPENRVTRPDRRIVFVLDKMCGRHGHHYCFPSQDFINAKLARWFRAAMSRRNLCRHLNALQQGAYIRRKRRLEYSKREGLKRRSTMYFITRRDVAAVGKHAIAVAAALASARASSRVPETSQYLKIFIRDLSLALDLCTGRGPPDRESSPPRKRGG